MPETRVPLDMVGRVVMRDMKRGGVILDTRNTVVDAMYELLVRAMIGEDTISRIHAAKTNGEISRGLRTLGNIQLNVPVEKGGDLAPLKTRDIYGLRSIGTWTGLLQPTGIITYDTLGLVSNTGLLCAVTRFPDVTIGASDTIAVQWTIALRGNR